MKRPTPTWLVLTTTGISAVTACSSSDGETSGATATGGTGGGLAAGGSAGSDASTGSGGLASSGGTEGAPTCGNGTVEAPEQCDGTSLGGQTCASATLNATAEGSLACTTSCTLDVSGCTGSGGGTGTGGGPGTGGVPGSLPDGGSGGGSTETPDADLPGGHAGIPSAQSCTGFTLPAVSDYGARGPFPVKVVTATGPTGQYTLFRPVTLGEAGFMHPPATWGNGITTKPEHYTELLSTFASHGFVVIASDSTNVTADLMASGLDWLIAQNTTPGDFQGKLVPSCAVTIGYSLGGGAAVNAGSHAGVVATVSFHGLQGAAENGKGPLLLMTSTADGFVTKAGYVQPTYDRSSAQPTIMATLRVDAPADFAGHLLPIGDAGPERAPAVAWLRYWVYGDQGAKGFFYGASCTLCQAPWTDIQRKNAAW